MDIEIWWNRGWKCFTRAAPLCDIFSRGSSFHTHPFNGPFSRTTQVSRYQKGKTNLDFTESRDSEWQWHQLEHMQVCTSLQTDNHANTPPLSFLQAGCPSCRPTNSVNALVCVTMINFVENLPCYWELKVFQLIAHFIFARKTVDLLCVCWLAWKRLPFHYFEWFSWSLMEFCIFICILH